MLGGTVYLPFGWPEQMIKNDKSVWCLKSKNSLHGFEQSICTLLQYKREETVESYCTDDKRGDSLSVLAGQSQ